jgi:cell wall-associated NlpC family hydrolase
MTAIELDPGVGGQCIGEDALQVADLIVSTTAARVSRAIRSATSSPVSHAMLYVGNGHVIEAIQEGVVERPLAAALAEATLAVAYRRLDLTPELAQAVIAYARQHVGRSYDYGGALGAGAASVSRVHCVVALGILGCAVARSGRFQHPNRFFCSELVLESFRRVGLPISNVPPAIASPNEIPVAFSHGVLLYVGHLAT